MIEQHVTSLEISKQLKEDGWTKETEFCWSLCADTMSTNFGKGEFRITTGGLPKETKVEHYPAPLATEILEELPRGICIRKGWGLKNSYVVFDDDICVGNGIKYFRGEDEFNEMCNDNICANALAKAWMYFKKLEER